MRVRQVAAQWHETEQMRITIAAVLLLLTGAASAEPSTLFYNTHGQITGSASTSGNVTMFRDRQGRMSGTAERQSNGRLQESQSPQRDGGGLFCLRPSVIRLIHEPLQAPGVRARPTRWLACPARANQGAAGPRSGRLGRTGLM